MANVKPDDEKRYGGHNAHDDHRAQDDDHDTLDEEQTVGAPIDHRPFSNVDAPVPLPDPDANFEPPDRGWLAWSQVLAALFINMMTWGLPATFGVFQLYYVEELGLPGAQVSWIGSIQVCLSFLVCTVSGRLSDAGFARQTVAVGCFLVVFGMFMTSLCKTYWQILLAQGVCTGLGLGVAFMPAVSVASSYFKKNRAFALAIAATGTSFGSLIFPSVVQYLIPKIGFAWAVRCEAFVALVIALIANALLKPYLKPRKTGPWVEWGAFKELPYTLFALGGFLNLYTLYFGFFYINSFAREVIGFTSVDAVGVLLIANGLGIPARPIVGYLADNVFGPINTYMTFLCCLGIVIYSWIGVHTRAGMYIFAAFYGVISGASQGVYVGALASLTTDPRKMGTRFGMVSTLCAFAVLAGPPTAGAIIERSGGVYTWAQVWGGTVAVVGSCSVACSRFVRTGPKLKVKI